jgi:hypothetical protein
MLTVHYDDHDNDDDDDDDEVDGDLHQIKSNFTYLDYTNAIPFPSVPILILLSYYPILPSTPNLTQASAYHIHTYVTYANTEPF